jgi:uncharacterized membrane protein YhiD involved in acid resistance
MNKYRSFQEFLSSQSIEVDLIPFIIHLVLAAALAFILSRMYVRFGSSLSNRSQFARNFALLAMTTMLIITIVKSSLALSLGLVGALSIIRFRAAIKEPEELSYLFLAIAIGLGFGAGQTIITLVAFVIICAVLVLKFATRPKSERQNLHLTISSANSATVSLDKISEALESHCSTVNLRRFDESSGTIEASFLVEFSDFERLNQTRQALRQLDPDLQITFLDNKGVI